MYEHWNDDTMHTASDAVLDILVHAHDELIKTLVDPIIRCSDYWAEQLARDTFGMESDHIDDFEALLTEIKARIDRPTI